LRRATAQGIELGLAQPGAPGHHRRHVVTTDDRELPVALQETSAVELGAEPTRLATGHLPMLQKPAELVALLAR